MKYFITFILVAVLNLGNFAQSQVPLYIVSNNSFFSPNQKSVGIFCNGNVQFDISVCPNSYSGSLVFNYIDWTFAPGVVVTSNAQSISYDYALNGDYAISGVVHATLNGTPITTSVEFPLTTGSDACVNNGSTTLSASVFIYNYSIYISNPVQPAVITDGQTVTYSWTSTGSPTSPNYSNPTSNILLDDAPVGGSPISGLPPQPNFYTGINTVGQHIIELVISNGVCTYNSSVNFEVQDRNTVGCASCFTFQPKNGERYWFSAWVKVKNGSSDLNVKTYSDLNAYAQIAYSSGSTLVKLYPEGQIIDGWQRIAGEFVVPNVTPEFINISLVNDNTSLDAYFDDVRIHPFNASMKSYVNDAATFWLVAELDDNNYATFYEYDKEGKLIRIKKETEKGIMTIQESRMSNPKN